MVYNPIKMTRFSSPIENTRHQFIKESVISPKPFSFKNFLTEKERLVSYIKYFEIFKLSFRKHFSNLRNLLSKKLKIIIFLLIIKLKGKNVKKNLMIYCNQLCDLSQDLSWKDYLII